MSSLQRTRGLACRADFAWIGVRIGVFGLMPINPSPQNRRRASCFRALVSLHLMGCRRFPALTWRGGLGDGESLSILVQVGLRGPALHLTKLSVGQFCNIKLYWAKVQASPSQRLADN